MITTTRLLIRESTIEDTAFIFELLNAPNWIKHIGERGINEPSDAADYIRNSLIHSYKTKGFGLYIVQLKESETPIGICGFVQRDYLSHPDIGFAILPVYEGKGYTTEAGLACMKYGREKLNFSVIYGITTPENTASQRVLQQLGLTKQKTIAPQEDGEELLLFST